jgi:HAD superfamily phosphatase (TIGR01681 family)
VDQRVLFKEVTARTQNDRPAEALQLMADAIRRGQLDAEGIDKAGRRCADLFERAGIKRAGRLLLLGQCTTTWIGPAVTAAAWADGRAFDVTEGAYDNVLQDILLRDQSARQDIVVLIPWNQRLLAPGQDRTVQERVAEEAAFWRKAWSLVETRLAARIIQVGFDCMTPGAFGYGLGARPGGDVALVRDVNQQLRDSLPPGAVFVDLEQISGEMGRERFYDPRRYHWTKQPFSEAGTVRLGEHIAAAARAAMTGPKKVLVLDLDNTMWGGVVGETGPLGITLGDGPDGEAFTAFQKHVKRLSERGVVLAVCSKNNDADAREPFEKNPNMVVSIDDIAQFEASWDPKAVAIRRIAKGLQLGLDSFVFVDDNPAEREHIRQALH